MHSSNMKGGDQLIEVTYEKVIGSIDLMKITIFTQIQEEGAFSPFNMGV